MLPDIQGPINRQLLQITKSRLPLEAGGLIVGDRVIEITNHAVKEDSFEFHREEIIEALKGVEDIESVAIWHSHPKGGIGPSRIDMQQKTSFTYHLVVALVNDELIPTWY